MKKTERRMNNSMTRAATLMLPLLLISWLFVGCTEDQPTGIELTPKTEILSFEQSSDMTFLQGEEEYELLKQVRQATARFNSTNQAIRAGYEGDDHCVAHPVLGGMGYHWSNQDLVDPVFDPMVPEAVLYEKDKNGKMKLIAVEYVVIDVGQPHPHFGGQPFDIGGTPVPVDHYSLHVWLYKYNPNGIYTPYNPNVVCPA